MNTEELTSFFQRTRASVADGEWVAYYDIPGVASTRLERGLCPTCGRRSVRTAEGWRRCDASQDVEYQVRAVDRELVVVARGQRP